MFGIFLIFFCTKFLCLFYSLFIYYTSNFLHHLHFINCVTFSALPALAHFVFLRSTPTPSPLPPSPSPPFSRKSCGRKMKTSISVHAWYWIQWSARFFVRRRYEPQCTFFCVCSRFISFSKSCLFYLFLNHALFYKVILLWLRSLRFHSIWF